VILGTGTVGLHQRAEILSEERNGPLPTIVVGGFVPDPAEAVYLLRGSLLKQGSVFYMNFPRRGFSAELFLAQLGDLVAELAERRGRPPVLLSISFGAGLVLEWLRRTAVAGRPPPPLAGLVLVSPVACVGDLLETVGAKPTTLLGRALKPYLAGGEPVDDAQVEKSRALFVKMFEAGAKNETATRALLAPAETLSLSTRVLGTINAIDARGATERVQALHTMPAPACPRQLHPAPTLVLYAEKESAVLCATSPTTRELTTRLADWFPAGRCLTVTNTPTNPVQHASLVFHAPNFAPLLAGFYRELRVARRQVA
jgi:hypothetical protein